MKKLLTIFMIFSLFFLTSCFNKKENTKPWAINSGEIEKILKNNSWEIEEKTISTSTISETNTWKIEEIKEINSPSNEKENVKKDEKIDQTSKEIEDKIDDLINSFEIFTSEKN